MTGTELDGATELGFPNALAGGPGQFAARWNAHSEEERAAWLRAQQDAADVALRCRYIEAHREQLQHFAGLAAEYATFRHEAGEEHANLHAHARAAERRLEAARAMLQDAAERHREGVRGDLLEDVQAILAGPLAELRP